VREYLPKSVHLLHTQGRQLTSNNPVFHFLVIPLPRTKIVMDFIHAEYKVPQPAGNQCSGVFYAVQCGILFYY
jgi:hypothetical protein